MDIKLNKYACRYAIVRFVPFAETEEFVNIGVVVACPVSGYFGFKLQKKRRHSRVTGFFSDVGKESYKEAIEMFTRELSRIQFLVSKNSVHAPDEIRRVFDALVHPREALIQFSQSRSRMASNPDEVLEKLFGYYVERNFVTHEYKEQVLERRIRNLVHSLHLPKPFKALEVGDEFAAAHFPLVQLEGSVPVKAIKPFFLGQPEPSKIISHGGLWVDRLRRMRMRKSLPPAVLFAVDGPGPLDGKRHSAYLEICDDLNKLDILTVPSNAEHDIVSFAESR